MEHLYADGKEGAPAIRWAKETAERRKCNHWQTKASADECIAGIIGACCTLSKRCWLVRE